MTLIVRHIRGPDDLEAEIVIAVNGLKLFQILLSSYLSVRR